MLPIELQRTSSSVDRERLNFTDQELGSVDV
jgi:hypothetical protein